MSNTIAIDASRLSVTHLTGTETYTFQLLSAMAELEPPEHVELYFNAASPPPGAPALGEAVCIPFPRFWTHARLSLELKRRRPQVLFVPAHVVPLLHPRSVVTIHDLGYLHEPESHTKFQVRMLDRTTRWSARAAARIIAISEFTKRDLVERYGIDPDKITVVRHGVAEAFIPAPSEEVNRVRTAYSLSDRYVLAVGTVQPRKNYGRLAAAVASLNRTGRSIELVIAGKRGWLAEQVEADVRATGANVRWLGYVPDRDLPALYSGADVTCQPSLFEGFGMPAIEAMACGSLVVASDRAALPEICGDAAFYVDPTNLSSIALGLTAMLSDNARPAELKAAGIRHASSFTWQRCAQETLAVLRQTAAS